MCIVPSLPEANSMVHWFEFMTRLMICVTGTWFGVPSLIYFSLVLWYHSPTTVNYRTSPTPLHFCFDTIALIGLLGSITLLIGAVVGVVSNRWITLLPGTVLLLIALASLFEPYLWAAVIMVVVLPLLLNMPRDSFEEECHGPKMPC
jgi:lysylphosphatidylglycerol synthetase-like protein (DUF2156 family)